MSDSYPPPAHVPEPVQPPVPAGYPPPPPQYGAPSGQGPTGQEPVPMSQQMPMGMSGPARGPIGQVRGTGLTILLYIVTLGIYGWFWYYKVHDEMKRHSGEGLGGGIALVLAIFVGIAMPYVTANEVGSLYKRAGRAAPVSAATGLWSFPGIFILVGPIIWFVKTNGALNDYWRSLGATG